MTHFSAAPHQPNLCPVGGLKAPIIQSTPINSQENYLEDIKLIKEMDFEKSLQQLHDLQEFSKNWDGYGAEKPSIQAITIAEVSLRLIFSLSQNSFLELSAPNVTASSEGDIVFEWWNFNKKLTLYISAHEIIYIKIFGEKIEHMEDGVIDIGNQTLLTLFKWLFE